MFGDRLCVMSCTYAHMYVYIRCHIESFRGVVLSGIGTDFIGSPLHSKLWKGNDSFLGRSRLRSLVHFF